MPIEKPHSSEDKRGIVFRQTPSAQFNQDSRNRRKVNVPSPHDLNFIDHLPHSFYANNRLSRQPCSDQIRPHGPNRCLCPIRNADLVEDVLNVLLDGLTADVHRLSNLLVG